MNTGPCSRNCEFKNHHGYCQLGVCAYHEPARTTLSPVTYNCAVCGDLDLGDTLYSHSSDDVGDIYTAIRNIRYCPVCGQMLRSFTAKMTERRANHGTD